MRFSSNRYLAIILAHPHGGDPRLPWRPENDFFCLPPRPRLQRLIASGTPPDPPQQKPPQLLIRNRSRRSAGAPGRSRSRPDRPRRKGVPAGPGQLSRRPPRSRQTEFRFRLQPASGQRIRSPFRRPPGAGTRPHSGRHQRPRTSRPAARRRIRRAEIGARAHRRSQRTHSSRRPER